MNDIAHKGLLPTGLADILPPEAEYEAEITEMLMASFAQYGYERVKQPLIEFEDVEVVFSVLKAKILGRKKSCRLIEIV